MNVMGYDILSLANSFRAEDGKMILFPLLTSGFPINAGEYTLKLLMNILLAAGGPPPP